MSSERITIRVDEKLNKKLDILSEKLGRYKSELIRELLEQYIEQQENMPTEKEFIELFNSNAKKMRSSKTESNFIERGRRVGIDPFSFNVETFVKSGHLDVGDVVTVKEHGSDIQKYEVANVSSSNSFAFKDINYALKNINKDNTYGSFRYEDTKILAVFKKINYTCKEVITKEQFNILSELGYPVSKDTTYYLANCIISKRVDLVDMYNRIINGYVVNSSKS